MSSFYIKYFANVRWVELLLSFGVAVLADLQLTVQSGNRIDQSAIMKALSLGAGVAWAYLRMPKAGEDDPSTSVGGLPPGVDETGPAHDVSADAVTAAISGALGPIGAAAPDLAVNITKELGRVLKRGIRL